MDLDTLTYRAAFSAMYHPHRADMLTGLRFRETYRNVFWMIVTP